MTVRASNEFQRNLKTLHVQPSACSLKRPRSPEVGRTQDVNQNPVKMRCRPALDRAMSIISNREHQHHQHHQCYFCGTIFPNAEVLQAHRKMPHSYTCDECPRRFATRSELDRHNLHPEGLAISSSSSDSSKCLYPVVEESNSKEKAKESVDKTEVQSLKQRMENGSNERVRKEQINEKTDLRIEKFELLCEEEFFVRPTYESEIQFDGSFKVTVSVDGTDVVGTAVAATHWLELYSGDTVLKCKVKACKNWIYNFNKKNFQKSSKIEEKNDNEATGDFPLRAATSTPPSTSTCIPDLTGDVKKNQNDQASSHDDKDATKSNVHLQDSSDPPPSTFLDYDQSPVHNSHDHSDQDSSPGFHQSSNAEKDKVCGDQDSKEFNDFVEGVITISSESDSDGDSYDEAPELKMSSDDSGSDSLGFSFRPSPWHFPPKSRH